MSQVLERQAPIDAAPSVVLPTLDAHVRGKFMLFAIPSAEQVAGGPVMRGFVETEAGKVNVAGWKRVGRESGNEYLSLRVGNTRTPQPGESDDEKWTVGPYYGRLFREVTVSRGEKRTRYFGFIEDATKAGLDEVTHEARYRTLWELQVRARPAISGDGRTGYISGTVQPAGNVNGGEPLPF